MKCCNQTTCGRLQPMLKATISFDLHSWAAQASFFACVLLQRSGEKQQQEGSRTSKNNMMFEAACFSKAREMVTWMIIFYSSNF
jgi:hypothetical protein